MPSHYSKRTVLGFETHSLNDGEVQVTIVPELGGRVVSLCDKVSGREWMDGWLPATRRRMWKPTDPANYETGPGAGLDECLPTVLPCVVKGKSLPDHGDLWNQAAELDQELSHSGILACSWKRLSLPLAFARRIFLQNGAVHFDYRLENLSKKCTPFQWAWHPLFTWKPGDEIKFGPRVNQCMTPDGKSLAWPQPEPGRDLSRASFAKGTDQAAKVFMGPLSKGKAEISSRKGARIAIAWPAELFPYAGIWITRGFWKGLHHWAIEPTNAPVDRLSDISKSLNPSLWMLDPGEVHKWRVTVRFPRA